MRTVKPYQLKRAVERNPNACPYCDSSAIDCGPLLESVDNKIVRDVSCEDCDREWQETFDLISVISH